MCEARRGPPQKAHTSSRVCNPGIGKDVGFDVRQMWLGILASPDNSLAYSPWAFVSSSAK